MKDLFDVTRFLTDKTCRMNDNARSEVNRISNRHKARILHNLEIARCPTDIKKIVIDGLNYQRSDLAKVAGSENKA